MKDCKLCGETGEVVKRPSRLIGATYWDGDSGDERLEQCPICCKGDGMTFDEWYEEFQKELARQSGTDVIPKGMDKESYLESYYEEITPSDRAWQELDDLSR